MSKVLFAVALIGLGYGCLMTFVARTAIHQIQAGIGFLIFAICLGSAAIVEAIWRSSKTP